MRWGPGRAACVAGVVALLTGVATTRITDIRVLSAVGMRQVLLDLAPKFERATGHTVTITFDSSGVIPDRLERGESPDIVMSTQAGIQRLAEANKLIAGSPVDLATSGVGVAVRKGAPGLDIGTPDKFKEALLRAGSIAYPDPAMAGSSGLHIPRVLERLGIAAAMKSRTIFAPRPGPDSPTPGSLVAMGKADIALHQMQELMAVQGIDIVGPFPGDLQQTFVFSAGIMTGARDVNAARALMAFLQTPEATAVLLKKGMGTIAR